LTKVATWDGKARMSIFRYLIRRLISGLLAFFIFTGVIFFGFNLLIPFDYVTTLSLVLTGTAAREALRDELGLNLPLWQQYVNWLKGLAQGNLGREFTLFGEGTPVVDLLADAVPSTLLVFVTGALAAFAIGHWLGKLTAWRVPRWFSGSATFASIALYTAFPPWLAFLLGFVLIDTLGIPTFQRLPTRSLWIRVPFSQADIVTRMIYSLIAMLVVFFVLRWLVRRLWHRRLPSIAAPLIIIPGMYLVWVIGEYAPYAVDIAKVAALPFIAFVLLGFGDTMLLMQAGMVDTRHEMYIQTARAKGLPERIIRDKHAARNALMPVLSRFVINLPYLLTAIVILERATNWPGIGDLLFRSIYDQNTFIYMDILVIVGLITLLARLALDVIYVYLDPRIRYGDQIAGSTA
jgi:peptide/nickel transport system permease protein